MKKIAVLVARCYSYDKELGSCAKSRSSLTVPAYLTCPSSAVVLGSQHHFSPVSLLMINALSLSVLLFETNLELGHAGDREEKNR